MTTRQEAIESIGTWLNGLPKLKQYAGLPAKGSVGGALQVLERLKEDYTLDLDYLTTEGRSQVRGAGGAGLARILARFGETRPFLAEGGRTNRGLRGAIAPLLDTLQGLGLDALSTEERNNLLNEMQEYLIHQIVNEYFNKEHVRFIYDPSSTAWELVSQLLRETKEAGKDGPVAQYLVGAKLAIRFPQLTIRNDSYSTADVQTGQPADFLVNDTSFHVTVSPTPRLLEKCVQNARAGFRVYLLVPYDLLAGAKQNADIALPGRITVQSIESFVSQNIEELSEFASNRLAGGLRRLLDKYNERVDQVEMDKSILIETPQNLNQ